MADSPGWLALKDSLATLFVPSTLIAAALSFAVATGLHHASSPDLGGALLGSDAALVALILPAAALANGYLEGRMLEYLARILTGGDAQNLAGAADSVDRHAKAVVASVRPLLRGFTFLLISFAFAIGALFPSTSPIWPSGPGWVQLPPSDICAGAALGFDLVGVLLLFPFAWILLDHELAEKTSKLIHWQAEQYRTANEAALVQSDPVEAQRVAAEMAEARKVAEEKAAAEKGVRPTAAG